MAENNQKPLRASLNCDMGEGYSLYRMADDEALMKVIHLANIACGFHASDFDVMNTTVSLAKENGVQVGAHPSLPDRQGFGRREMAMKPDELFNCFTYQVGALSGFLKVHGMTLHHVKPHGAVYGQMARDLELARAGVRVCKTFSTGSQEVAFVGLPGTMHGIAAKEEAVRFIPEWFADLEYDTSGKLLITKKHDPVPANVIENRVMMCGLVRVHKLLRDRLISTNIPDHHIPLNAEVDEVTICVHSDTPGAVDVAKLVKDLVDKHNRQAGYV